MFPKIINVAVPSPQHSPIFGQLPEVQIVWRLYLSTSPLSSVYFFPVGSFTRSHFGFGLCIGLAFRTSVFIDRHKDTLNQKSTQVPYCKSSQKDQSSD